MAKTTSDHPVLTLIVFVLLLVVGVFTLGSIAIDLMPEIDLPYVIVSTSYDNAGPESVEKSVTKTLESVLVSVEGLKKLTSTSSEGASLIALEFDYGVNLDSAVNDIRDKLDMVRGALPDEADSPRIFKINTSSMPIMRIAVRGNRSAEDLKQYAEDEIENRLLQVNNVAQVSTYGGREKIVRVEVSQNRLDAYGLTLTGVASALAAQNLDLGGGKITESATNYLVRTVGEFTSVEEISNSVVGVKNGYSIKLSDIATVFSGFKDETSAVYIDSEPGVYLSIQKQSGSNSVSVADSVYDRLDEIRKTLPADISLEIISDDTDLIRDTIATLLESACQGALLAMAILFLFLRSFKSTLIIGVSIPISVVITLLAMNFAGITLNMMTLTGLILGVGMIVDASIVILENIFKYRERGAQPKVAAVLGSQEVFMSVFSGNVTTICVFVPFLFFQKDLGFFGIMFQDMIFTVVISLLASLFVAVFLVPVLAGHFLPVTNRNEKPIENKTLKKLDGIVEGGLQGITNAYRKALSTTLKYRKTTVAVTMGLLLLSLAAIPFMNIVMMPESQETEVALNITLPLGTDLETTRAVVQQMEAFILQDVKGIKHLISNVGTSSGIMSGESSYEGSISIQLFDIQNQIDTSDVVKDKVRARFTSFPAATFTFGQGQAGSATGDDIDIAVRSDNLDAAIATAKQIIQLMGNIPEISEADVDMKDGLPQIEVEIDRQRAYSFGVNVAAAAREINACINGMTSTIYRSDGKDYDVVVMYRPEDRTQLLDVENIFVQGSAGRVSVANFATVKTGVGPVSINRQDQTRIVHVTASLPPKTQANEIEKLIQKSIDSNIIIPDGVSVAFEGSWKEMKKMGVAFILIIVLAIILVFGVMAGTYESFKDPFINILTIPLLIIGVIGIYLLIGQPISVISAIGIIMLVGIVVNNGIILVDYTKLLTGRGMLVREACLEAGVARLRPVLMSTLTTILGMLPMCFAASSTASMIQPIGLAVVGGLTSSTFITLLFIPVVYSLFNEKSTKQGNRAAKKAALLSEIQNSEEK